jgi:hypothetical protein
MAQTRAFPLSAFTIADLPQRNLQVTLVFMTGALLTEGKNVPLAVSADMARRLGQALIAAADRAERPQPAPRIAGRPVH